MTIKAATKTLDSFNFFLTKTADEAKATAAIKANPIPFIQF